MTETTEMSNVIPLIQTEAAQLHTDLARLDAAGWLRPSACAAWTVGDVLAHLTQGAHTWSASLRRAMAGDAGAPPGEQPGEQPLRSGERGSEATAQRAMTFRQSMTPAALLQAYAESYTQLQQVLECVTTAHWHQPCYHRRGTMLVCDYVGVRLQELLVHGWDMRSAFDATARPSVPPAAVLLRLAQRWLSHTFRATPALTTPVRYRFDITAPMPLQQDVLTSQDGVQISPATDVPADVTLRCLAGDYLLLVYGRLALEPAISAGRFTITGSRQQALLFPALFQGL